MSRYLGDLGGMPFPQPTEIVDPDMCVTLLGLLYRASQGMSTLSDLWELKAGSWVVYGNGHNETWFTWTGLPVDPGQFVFLYEGWPAGNITLDSTGIHLVLTNGQRANPASLLIALSNALS